MNLNEMDEVLAEREAKAAANRALANRWLGGHNTGNNSNEDAWRGWSYPCRNNCHSHCQSGGAACNCPCHDGEWGGAC